jgi:predicted amidohydrolase YtcJ
MAVLSRRTVFGLGLGLATPAAAASKLAPDTILHNARIWAGKDLPATAEALAITDGRILAIGSNSDILALKAPTTRLIDAQGRRVIPGINDAHDHAGSAAPGIEVHTQPPAEADATRDVLVAAIASAAAAAPKDQWLFATAGASVMRDPAGSLRAIEAVSNGHPVAVMAWWGHGLVGPWPAPQCSGAKVGRS